MVKVKAKWPIMDSSVGPKIRRTHPFPLLGARAKRLRADGQELRESPAHRHRPQDRPQGGRAPRGQGDRGRRPRPQESAGGAVDR